MIEKKYTVLLVESTEEDLVLPAIAQCAIVKQVLKATTLLDAIESLYETPGIDIVVSGLSFPDASGPAVISKIASSHPHIPIVVLTDGKIDPILRIDEKTLSWGAQEVVSTITPQDLEQAMRRAILRKLADREVRYRATHDQLTKLHNRVHLRNEIERSMQRFKRYGHPFTVVYLDLDKFKPINDTYGHEAGDQVLQEVADRLRLCGREGEVVARVGGDEFAMVVEGVTPGRVCSKILEALLAPIRLPNQVSVSLGVSIGYCTVTPDTTTREMFRAADKAMFRAKRDGGNRYYPSSPHRRSDYEEELAKALERGEFFLVYQPIVSAEDTSRVQKCEALLRWRRPNREHNSPFEIIPALEHIGEIVRVGEWVLDQAFSDLPHLQAIYPGCGISVNLATQQLEHGVIETLSELLKKHIVPPEAVTLEVTESSLLRNSKPLYDELEKIQKLGVRISLDDFGTGFSSLSTILDTPINEAKIDKSFTEKLPDHRAKVMVRALVASLKELGTDIVAEGVETAEQEQILIELGVKSLQGFRYHRPTSLRD